ncbi:hypothetical protein TIFTF001_015210 [Ficus carica]|uniref:Uncharacterized protein n=1 Tax=Ficus carica TaxID=3494 RepID=A0AA88A0S7_FICCA|nr:hypothetical protein TIFTF001_015210 [Ficus carica]
MFVPERKHPYLRKTEEETKDKGGRTRNKKKFTTSLDCGCCKKNWDAEPRIAVFDGRPKDSADNILGYGSGTQGSCCPILCDLLMRDYV